MCDLICQMGGELILSSDVQEELIAIEESMKSLKKRQDELKERLLYEMETLGLKKFETDLMTLTYIAESERETFSSAKLKKAMPDIYNKFAEISTVKPQIRVKVHEK